MWIRSQNGHSLIPVTKPIRWHKLDKGSIFEEPKSEDVSYYIECNGNEIGTYDTEAQTLKVLDKIQRNIEVMPRPDMFVFQMPTAEQAEKDLQREGQA